MIDSSVFTYSKTYFLFYMLFSFTKVFYYTMELADKFEDNN